MSLMELWAILVPPENPDKVVSASNSSQLGLYLRRRQQYCHVAPAWLDRNSHNRFARCWIRAWLPAYVLCRRIRHGHHVRPTGINLVGAISLSSKVGNSASWDVVEPVIRIVVQKIIHTHVSSLDVLDEATRAPGTSDKISFASSSVRCVTVYGMDAGMDAGRTSRGLKPPGSQLDLPPIAHLVTEHLNPRHRRS